MRKSIFLLILFFYVVSGYDCDDSDSFVITGQQQGSVGCDSYGLEITMSWLIQVDSNQRINFFLETQETEDEQDYIQVYDGM